MPQFGRQAELIVGQTGKQGISIKDLRFSFKIEKTSSETLNKSTVRIYNLNPDNRKLVETPNNVVILKAGYEQDGGPLTIFVGVVRRSLTMSEGCDWITELELDDGLMAYRDSKFSLSFAPGANGLDVLKSIASKFGLPVCPLPADITDKSYLTGFSFVGRSREAMGRVTAYLGLEWSIQNQEIQILKKGGHVKRIAVLISPDTGMIGSPALEAKTMNEKLAAAQGITTNSAGVITKRSDKKLASGKNPKERFEIQGYKVKCQLSPTLLPGGVVQIKSAGIDNFFKIEKLTHSGDTEGKEWHSEISVRFI